MSTVGKVLQDLNSMDKAIVILGNMLSAARNGVGDTFAVDQSMVDAVFSAFGLTQYTIEDMWRVINSMMLSTRSKLDATEIDI